MKINYGNWNQGRKASNNSSIGDTGFKAMVKKIYDVVGEADDIAGMRKDEILKMIDEGRKDDVVATTSVLNGWI